MLTLHRVTKHQLFALLEQDKYSAINGLVLPVGEEIAPRFLLELVVDKLSQDTANKFWWSPRLIVVDKLIVGMCSFKSPPDIAGLIEIGYGIIPSQRRCSFATQAVDLLIKEGFAKGKVKGIVAHTNPHNTASHRVLEKNQFIKSGFQIDREEGKILVWQKIK